MDMVVFKDRQTDRKHYQAPQQFFYSFFLSLLSLVIITFVNFVVSAPILTSKLPVPLPHLLFTLSLITATLCTTTFQNLKQIVFRLFRTLLPGLWLRLPPILSRHPYVESRLCMPANRELQ